MRKHKWKLFSIVSFFLIFSLMFSSVTLAGWTEQTGSGSKNWIDIASSSDGTKLIAAVYGTSGNRYLYTSTDSGVTWTERTGAGSRIWRGVASSSDGTKLVAVATSSNIYTSTDSGVTWVQRTGSGARAWLSVTSSSDGTKLAAVVSGGYIYTSTDSGVTWTARTGPGNQSWNDIASSSDGTKLVASINGTHLYTSTDSGVTWVQRAFASLPWRSVASSSDGTKLVAAASNYNIYTSTDSGVTWTLQNGSGLRNWGGLASSSDGTKLAAVVTGTTGNRYIYTSTDSGVTWFEDTSAGSKYWYGIASSSDGTKLAAVVYGGYISTYVYTSPASITITPSADISITEGVNNPTAYTVSLGSLPTANVTITITEASNAINVENPTLTFTPLNWNTPQTVSVTGSQDANTVSEVDQVITFDPSSTDAGYNALPNQTRNVDVTDNDTPSFSITPVTDLSMTEGATNSTAYQVVLGTEPASNVVIDITESSPQITLNTTSLTFTSGNWNVPQDVSITATEDNSNSINEQDQIVTFAINDAASDNQFDPLANQTRQIDFIDNDIPSFSITQTGGNTSVIEEGATDTFSIVLGSQPSGNVVIDVSSSDTTALTLSAPEVSFTTVDWNIPKNVTVTGPNDPDTDSESITITATIDQPNTLDTNYDTLPAQNFTASVTDNDIPVNVVVYENKFPPVNTNTVTQRKSGSLKVGGFRSQSYVRLDSLVKIPTGAGAGKVLTSDAQGFATWQTTGSSSGTTTWGSITGTLADQYDLQNALNLKASLNNPQFIGEPKSNEALALNDNDTSVATTAFVQSKIGSGTGGANGWSDTGNQVSLITSSDNISIGETSVVYKGGSSNSNRFIHNKGIGNTFLGLNSGSLNLSGQYNTAVGNDSLLALDTILTGEKNTAFGYKTLSVADSFTSNNTAIGSKALGLGGGGVYNTGLGYETLLNTYTTNGSSIGAYNTAVGYQALKNNTTGSYNVAVGSGALINNTTGSYNIAIGYGAGPTTGNLFNTVAIGYGATVSQSNKVRIGNTSISTIEFQVVPTVVSDLRLKENINDSDLGLEFIKKLRPVSYTMKQGNGIDYGFIAQEVESAIGKNTNIVLTDNTEFGMKTLRYASLISPLTKAIQEQQEVIEEYKKTVEEYEKRVEYLESLKNKN